MLTMQQRSPTVFKAPATTTESDSEPEEVIKHHTALKFDPSRIVAHGTVKSIKGNKTIKLLNLRDSESGSSCKIEFQTPMKMVYPYDEQKGKITLQLGSRYHKYREIFQSLQARGMVVASEHSPDGWTIDDLKNLYWNNPPANELRLKIRKDTKFLRIDPEDGSVDDADSSVLQKGALVYPVSKIPFVWYTSDSCGMTQEAACLAVLVPSDINGFDFLLDGKTTSNLTNRLYPTVCFDEEADFSRKIHTAQNEIGNISYYLNIDDFQMSRTRCPFGFDPRVNDETGVENDYATVEFDLDEKSTDFFKQIDDLLPEKIVDSYASWFASKPDYVDKQFLLDKKVYKSCFVPASDEYKGRYPVKAYKTGHKMATDYWVYEPKTESYRPGTHEDLTRQCEVLPIISISKLFFKGSGNRYSKIGSTVILKRVIIYPEKRDTVTGMHLFKKKKKNKRKAPENEDKAPENEDKADEKRAKPSKNEEPNADDVNDACEDEEYV